jgi:ppGpp synthetase/RelA/SpoT-type nucleotidyltranferase
LPIEVQLRTYLQDVWANQVEGDSRRRRIDYKSGVGQREVHDFYVAMSELFEMSEASITPSADFSKELHRRRLLAEPFLS